MAWKAWPARTSHSAEYNMMHASRALGDCWEKKASCTWGLLPRQSHRAPVIMMSADINIPIRYSNLLFWQAHARIMACALFIESTLKQVCPSACPHCQSFSPSILSMQLFSHEQHASVALRDRRGFDHTHMLICICGVDF